MAPKTKNQVEEIEVDEDEETESAMTPKALAAQLEISPKSLRAFLRREFPRSSDEKNTSWKLTDAQVESAIAHFTSDEDEETEDDE